MAAAWTNSRGRCERTRPTPTRSSYRTETVRELATDAGFADVAVEAETDRWVELTARTDD